MFMEIVLGMRGNHPSGRGSQSLGRGRRSQQTIRGEGIQQFFSESNTTNVLPHSPTYIEDTLPSHPLDTPVLSTTDIPSSSHSAPTGNVSSIPLPYEVHLMLLQHRRWLDFHNPCKPDQWLKYSGHTRVCLMFLDLFYI